MIWIVPKHKANKYRYKQIHHKQHSTTSICYNKNTLITKQDFPKVIRLLCIKLLWSKPAFF